MRGESLIDEFKKFFWVCNYTDGLSSGVWCDMGTGKLDCIDATDRMSSVVWCHTGTGKA
jgi:hypothetical protein